MKYVFLNEQYIEKRYKEVDYRSNADNFPDKDGIYDQADDPEIKDKFKGGKEIVQECIIPARTVKPCPQQFN